MSETTLKFTTRAELEGLKQYIDHLKLLRTELGGVTRASQQASGATQGKAAGAQAGPATGGAPPEPEAVGEAAAPTGHQLGPPPPPPTVAGDPNDPNRRSWGVAPPPGSAQDTAQGGQQAAGMPPPGGGYRLTRDRMNADGSRERSYSRRPRQTQFQREKGQAHSYIRQGATTATMMGLGSGIAGFMLASGHKYLELSKVIAHLGQRFRSTTADATQFGASLGYTRAQTAGFVEAMGKGTNTANAKTFKRYMGFARQQGWDPGQASQTLGQMQMMQGGTELNAKSLRMLAGRASFNNMDEGRFGEQMMATERLMKQQLALTGRSDALESMRTLDTARLVFGEGDPRGQGSMGAGFMERFGGVMSSSGPMRNYMMRAMGYGTEGGPGYIEMRKRLEAGVMGPEGQENISLLFGTMQSQGMGREAQFKALESVSGGQLKAHEIESLVDEFGTRQGLVDFEGAMSGKMDQATLDNYLYDLGQDKEGEKEGSGRKRVNLFKKMGWAGLGAGTVSEGEGLAVEKEAMMMSVGKPVAKAMIDMTHVFKNLAGVGKNLLGMDLGKLLTDVTSSIDGVTASLNTLTKGGASEFGGNVARGLGGVVSGEVSPWQVLQIGVASMGGMDAANAEARKQFAGGGGAGKGQKQ